tara:strand:+ start:2921 stop:4168 length:1248 start_codon:yes stop_codon:yes gene_type:complete
VSRKNELIEFLRVELKEAFDCDVKFWIQGSYKSHTLIKPVDRFSSYDIDIGIYLFFDAESEGIEASDIKEALKDALNSYTNINDESELQDSKTACEGLKFKSFLTIDTPIYYCIEDDNVRLATDNGWVDSDPKSIQDYLTNSLDKDSDRALMKRVVRYLKAWANIKWQNQKYKKIPSLALNVLVAEHLHINDCDDVSFIETATHICEKLESIFKVDSPLDGSNLVHMPEEDQAFAHRQLDSLKSICIAAKKSDDADRTFIFSNLFEHYFPQVSFNEERQTGLPALTTVPDLSISRYDKNGKHIESINSDEITVFKGESMTFSINNKDSFPSGSNVHWTVRNIGNQASDANDIGQKTITPLSDSEKRGAAYTGKHSMECIVVDNGSVKGANLVNVNVKPAKTVQRKRKVFKGFRRR